MPFRKLTQRLTYANVTSTACLFMLLGGSAYAATAITGSDVRNGTLTSADIKSIPGKCDTVFGSHSE